ncbi:MAG TPA: hypothetical protein VMZ53_25815 [Kofleriaceae bacterium]|nr:hypothetical protein [Kofleriaceae bacterium]
MRNAGRSLLFAAVCSAGAGLLTSCSSAYADRIAAPSAPGPRIALAVAGEKLRAPYDVQVVTEDGDTAPTYAFRDRFYVQGSANQRYTIRVTNPTGRRVEAVVSVDGLDVVDGESGDLNKRGYIVPAYGEVRIEGFRTSLQDVASFRFTSVDNSYAGRKGKARNVGVIAVAIFEETAPPPDVEIVAPVNPRPTYRWEDDVDDRDWGSDEDAEASVSRNRGGSRHVPSRKDAAKADKRTAAAEESRKEVAPGDYYAPAPTTTATGRGGYAGGAAQGAPAARPYMPPPPPPHQDVDDGVEAEWQPPVERAPNRTNRPGLGTEFGESRYSAASYTKFVRAAGRPIAIAELRYNDVAGLMALGIPVAPMPDDGEIMMRETADPFPGDHFARAPR